MKILGISGDGYSPRYIAEVSLAELRAVFDLRYSDKFKPPEVGSEIDLAAGADFRNQIRDMLDDLRKLDDKHATFRRTLSAFLQFAKARDQNGPDSDTLARAVAEVKAAGADVSGSRGR